MPKDDTFVIVGASLTGAKAAQTLREEGFAGRIVLLGTERERPYERPPFTKGFLLGKQDREKTYVHEEGWYAANDVDLRLGVTATELDRAAKAVLLDTGERIGYDRLLLATGAGPRRLAVPGADLEGVHYVRTMGDSAALRAELAAGGRRVMVVGAGWIGLETAAAARIYGNDVTILEPERTPLWRVLGLEMGQVFADLHRARGVDLRLGVKARELQGTAGRVSAVLASDGSELPADIVIVGIGVVPNAVLAERAGLEMGDGVRVDASLRTSDPAIFAAGDVAEAENPLLGRRIRVEHWANALNGGPAAARAMLGQDVVYDRVPYFFSDQYDLGMETSGLVVPGQFDQVVYRGAAVPGDPGFEPEGAEFVAFWLSEGTVVMGMNVNVWDVTGQIQALVRADRPVDPARLADPEVPLDDLA